MELTVALALLTLVVGVPLTAAAAYLSWRKWRERPDLLVMKERFIAALITTFVVLVFSIIFVNNDREVPWLGLDATKLITRAFMLGLAIIPAVGWLVIYVASERKDKR